MRRLHVLVVDDEPTNHEVAGTILTKLGHEVTYACHGAEALSLCAEPGRRFDLILMDITMPVMDGIEATRRIRLIPQAASTPVMYVTGSSSSSAQKTMIEAQGDRFFTKPYRRQQLLEVMTTFLRAKGVIGPDEHLQEPADAA